MKSSKEHYYESGKLQKVENYNGGVKNGREEKKPAIAFVNSPIRSDGLLPIWSDRNPKQVPPINIPRNIEAARYSEPSIDDVSSSILLSSNICFWNVVFANR